MTSSQDRPTPLQSGISARRTLLAIIVLAVAGAVLIYLVFEFLLRAAQQAVLLLIDIADCSLRLTAAAESRMASEGSSHKRVGI